MKKNNIILIGFMGVGKGTVARAMVKEVGLKSHFRMGEKEEAGMVGLKSHFRMGEKEEAGMVGINSNVRLGGKEEAGIVGINYNFREEGKEGVCGSGTLVP